MPRIINQFGRKMCQKKRKDVTYIPYVLLYFILSYIYFYKNILLHMSGGLLKIRSVHKYALIFLFLLCQLCICFNQEFNSSEKSDHKKIRSQETINCIKRETVKLDEKNPKFLMLCIQSDNFQSC